MTQQPLKASISYTDHRQANVFLDINNKAQDIYDGRGVYLPYGWQFKTSSKDLNEGRNYSSNFKAVVLQNGDRYAIVYFGTDFSDPRDIWANGKMVAHQNPQQFKDALKFTEKFMRDNNVQPYQIDVIGNSEGASEGMYVMSKIEGINHGTFFNGYSPHTIDIDTETAGRIDNYRHYNDIVSKCGPVIGNDYIVGYKDDYQEPKGTAEFVNAHRILNMGDLTKSIPAKDYAQQNKGFKNKYSKGKLKSHEIGDIPKELYALADPDVNDRLRNNMVVKEDKPIKTAAASTSECVGSYPVSGYTRSDGTYVSDYTRSCGAAHNGNNPNYMSRNIPTKRSGNSFSFQNTTGQPIPENDSEQGCVNPEMMDKEFKKYKKKQQELKDSVIEILAHWI